MNMENVVGYVRSNLQKPVKPTPGKEFQKRPDGYKTFQAWLSLGYRPKNVVGDGMVFKMQDKPEGYTYFSKADVEPLTEDECRQLDSMGIKHGVAHASADQVQSGYRTTGSYKDRTFGSSASKSSKEFRSQAGSIVAPNHRNGSLYKDSNAYDRKNASRAGVFEAPSGAPDASVLRKFPNMAEIGKKTVYTINVETNGTNVDRDDVIRVVIVGKNDKGNNSIIFQSLFRPVDNLFWGKDEQERSHITADMLSAAPFPQYLAPYIQQILDKADYISTYDASFNLAFLKKSFGVSVPPEKVLDSKEIFKKHCPGESSYKMGDAVKKYIPGGESDYRAHQGRRDTEYDAKVMHALFEMERISIKGEQLRAASTKSDQSEAFDRSDDRER